MVDWGRSMLIFSVSAFGGVIVFFLKRINKQEPSRIRRSPVIKALFSFTILLFKWSRFCTRPPHRSIDYYSIDAAENFCVKYGTIVIAYRLQKQKRILISLVLSILQYDNVFARMLAGGSDAGKLLE